ncbi:MAG: hypothetical protein ACYDH1_15960, partial [Anaerolineaceae bacterium]
TTNIRQSPGISWQIPGRFPGLVLSRCRPTLPPANQFTNQYQKVSRNQLADSGSIPWVDPSWMLANQFTNQYQKVSRNQLADSGSVPGV